VSLEHVLEEVLVIEGGRKLSGQVQVSGAKNAALPLMIASLLSREPCVFHNVPNLKDVLLVCRLLEHFGAVTSFSGESCEISVPKLSSTEASYGLVKALRASFWILGPLLAREGSARVSLPGGDIIGARPVDMHLAVLTAMGADIQVRHGIVDASAPRGLHPIDYTFTFPSVGATHQALMTAALIPGVTVIHGAAREPEIVALCEMLRAMGAGLEGEGSSTIRIEGRQELGGLECTLPGDRIEAATYLLAGVSTRSPLTVRGFNPEHLGGFLAVLDEMGVTTESISGANGSITLSFKSDLRPVSVRTEPFPGFATDIQAPLIAALTTILGESVVEENIFEGRFGHASELSRMGADILVSGSEARIRGGTPLSGARVEARDIRAGAALVVAGLAADGRTEIADTDHLRRGYSFLEDKLRGIGAGIRQEQVNASDYLFSGCM
jgi:UDP-N-acetylglucosamine 1-carboxyvinyltransferase